MTTQERDKKIIGIIMTIEQPTKKRRLSKKVLLEELKKLFQLIGV